MEAAIPVGMPCPFPGLRPFRRDEHALFFGRSEEVAELAAVLSGPRRFVAVIGTSGCGKSSLVEAGLLPHLLRPGYIDYPHWRVLRLRPVGAPISQLAEALAQLALKERPAAFGQVHESVLTARFRAVLRRTTNGMLDVIAETIPDSDIPILV